MYLANDNEMENDDILTDEDWAQLEEIYFGLKLFQETTMRLKGCGKNSSHGVV